MPIVDLVPPDPTANVDLPRERFVTPGALDMEEGQPAQRPDWGAVFGAQFRLENMVGSAAVAQDAGPREPASGFDPWPAIKGTPLEQHWARFEDVTTERAFAATRMQIEREQEDRRLVAAAPAWMSIPAGILAGTLDLPTLIPGGAFVAGAKGGFSIARSAANVGLATGGAMAVQEGGLHASQELRTGTESAANIGAGVVLGGLIGAAGAKLLSRAEWTRSVALLEREMSEVERFNGPVVLDNGVFRAADPQAAPHSLGAAALAGADLSDLTIAGAAAGTMASATKRFNPALRLINSPNAETRDTALNLFEMTQYLRGNDEGLATPLAVETLRKEWNAGLMQAVRSTNDAYSVYRKNGGHLARQQFREEVGRAMRRGDQHEVPEIMGVAQAWRAKVFEPLKEAAIAAKMLPEDVGVETAASYLSRMWNPRRLIAEEGQAKAVFTDFIHRSAPRWMADFDAEAAEKIAAATAKVEEAKAGGGAKLAAAERKLADMTTELRVDREARFGDESLTRARAEDIAKEVFDKLTGRQGEGTGLGSFTVESRGPLRGRTFKIPDEMVERWLTDDIDVVGRRYSRIMSADVELTRKFGSTTMQDQIKAIRESYNALREAAPTEAERLRLDKAEKSDITDISGVRDLLRGTYGQSSWDGNFGRIVRVANAGQYVLKMGQVVLASLTEAPRAAMVHGLRPFMEGAGAVFTSREAVKLSVAEAKLAGNINDRILSHRMATLAELDDVYHPNGKFERFMDNMTNAASAWNGIRLWTDGVKMLSSTIIQNRILKTVSAFDKASARDIRYLNWTGIDQSMAERIAKEFAEHGETVDRVRVANTERWADEAARRTYRAALNKDLDSTVVTRSVADIPLLANTPLGRLIFQFNTFNLASHQRVLLRGMQEGPSRFIGGTIALSSIGMLSTYLAAVAGNRTDKLPSITENPGWWIGEGLDRSGILSIPFQVANAMEKLSGINPIRGPLKLGDEGNAQSERVRARNDLGSVLGPSAGTLQDLGSMVGVAKTVAGGEEITKGQKSAMERLVPFNSYAGVRQMLRYVVNPPTE